MRGERGQATAEYVGVVLLVALVVAAAAALLAVTGLGERIVRAIEHALCVVTGGPCPDDDNAVRPAPCVVESAEHGDGGHLRVLFVRLGSSELALREQRADGRTALTIVDSAEGGVEIGAGNELRWQWGSRSQAYGGELRAAVLAEHSGGRMWLADDDASAQRLADQVRLADRSKPPSHSVPDAPDIAPLPLRVEAPPPVVTFTEDGPELALDLRRAKADLQLSAADVYGERVDHETGLRTVYVRRRAGAEGDVSIARGLEASGAGEAEERYGITYDRAGNPRDLEVLSALDVEGAVGLPPRLAAIAGLLKIPAGGEQHVETEQHLPLDDPEAVGVVAGFMKAFGEGEAAVALAAKALRDRLDREGTTSVRTYDSDAQAHRVGVESPLAGGEGGSTDTERRLRSAVARRGDGAWGPDAACGTLAA